MSKTKNTIAPKYVISFILKFSGFIFLGFGLFALIIRTLLNREVGPTYSKSINTLNQIHASLPSLIFTTAAIQAVALCVLAIILALIWSHSVAGPLIRFKACLKNIIDGKLLNTPVNFRETDQLQELASTFSGMALAHKDNHAKALALLVDAQKTLDECKANNNDIAKLKELKKIYQKIKDIYH